MAPGVSKTKWHGNGSSFQPETPSTSPDVTLCYEGKRDETEILSTHPALTRPIWGDEHARNHLYYGDNLPILAQLLQNPSLRGGSSRRKRSMKWMCGVKFIGRQMATPAKPVSGCHCESAQPPEAISYFGENRADRHSSRSRGGWL